MLQSEAMVAARAGRLREARGLSRQAAELAQSSGHVERAAIYAAGSAAWEAFIGNVAEARKNAAAALELSNARDVEYGSAFALFLTRRLCEGTAARQGPCQAFSTRYARSIYLLAPAQCARQLASLAAGRERKAIADQPCLRVRDTGHKFFRILWRPLPGVCARPKLSVVAQRYEAAAEFQKIIDHPGVVYADPVGALAYLEVGRACALSGNRARAKSAYQQFLTLWRDADPDITVYKQAKVEYSRLP